MKGTSIIELVVIMLFLMAGVPFLIMLVGKKSDYSYLQDKSMTTYETEYYTSDSMVDATSLRLNAAQVIYLPYVNDNYCPYPGNVTFLETLYYTSGKINDVAMFNGGERNQLDINLHNNKNAVSNKQQVVDLKIPNYRQSSKTSFDTWNSDKGTVAGVYDYINNNLTSAAPFSGKNGVSASVQASKALEDAKTNQLVYRMYLYQTIDSNSTVEHLPAGNVKVNRTWVISSYYPNTTY